VTAAPAQLLQQILLAVQRIRPGPAAPRPGDTFTGLGLDSLDRLTLAAAVEHATGLAVSDEALSGAASPGDLARLLLLPERTTP
jgi:acyl carrier protein